MIRHEIARLAVLLALSMCALPAARADKLNDFKEAASKEGCDAIPYSDMQSNCRSAMKDVGMWCDGYKGPVKCDIDLTDKLRRRIETEQKCILTAQEKRRELVDKRDRAADSRRKADLTAEIAAVDKDIETSNKSIDDAKTGLQQQKYNLQMIMDTITKCTEARTTIITIVGDASKKAGGESEPEIKDYAGSVRGKLAGFKSSQEGGVDRLTTSFKACKKGIP